MIAKCVAILIFTTIFSFNVDDNPHKSAVASITIDELRDHMYFLASDFLEGRVTDTRGYRIAVEYAVTQFRSAGIDPLFRNSEGKPSYLQEVTLLKKSFAIHKPWTATVNGKSAQYTPGVDIFLTNTGDVTKISQPVPVIYAGFGINSPEHGHDDLAGLEIESKIILIRMGAPLKDGSPLLPAELHDRLSSPQGWSLKVENLKKKKPLAVFAILDEDTMNLTRRIRDRLVRSQFILEAENQKDNDQKSEVFTGLITPEVAAKLLGNLPTEELPDEPGAIDNSALTIDVKQVVEKAVTWNVGGIIPGSNPELSDEYVSAGGHLDHVPPRNGEICNGADDNASGSIGILELAEALLIDPPERSTVLLLFAAEEIGHLGSKYFINHSPVPLDKIRVNLNLDMIGRTSPGAELPQTHYVVGADAICNEFRETILRVNSSTVELPLDFENLNGLFRFSDHYQFHLKGIPAAFFCSGHHDDVHSPGDDADKIDYDKMRKLIILAYELLLETGRDPQGPCGELTTQGS